MTDTMTISPFANGTQYDDWLWRNCLQCNKGLEAARCQIAEVLAVAYVTDGMLEKDVATRMGYPGPLVYVWDCPEKQA